MIICDAYYYSGMTCVIMSRQCVMEMRGIFKQEMMREIKRNGKIRGMKMEDGVKQHGTECLWEMRRKERRTALFGI